MDTRSDTSPRRASLAPVPLHQNSTPGAVLHLRKFLDKSVGSSLGAWLKVFDPDNDQRIRQGEFMFVLQTLGYDGDAKELFNVIDMDESGELSLEEVYPEQAELWQEFRAWCVETFRGVEDMLWRLGGNEALRFNQLTSAHFCEGIVQLGWPSGSEQLLFNALDIGDQNHIRVEDLNWYRIELVRFRRKEAAKLQAVQSARRRKGSAKRTLAHKRTVIDRFKGFVSQQYGGYFRAWRAVLSSPHLMKLRKRQFFKSLAEIGWTQDNKTLWKAFGKDDESYLLIDELDLPTACILARFRAFIHCEYGTAFNAFRRLDRQKKRKVSRLVFTRMLAVDEDLRDDAALIFHELRRPGVRFLTLEDFRFLDAWKPLGYLLSPANQQAAEEVKVSLLKHSKNYLSAWRKVLDVDSSNHCTWDEFEAACKTIGYEGDVGGAWRAFDADLSGSISLEEIDPLSSEILVDFKSWCDEEFGCVESAFGVFDYDRSGQLSLREWRRSCKIYGYDGCPRLLFNALDVDSSGTLSIAEIAFLDGWQIHPEDDQGPVPSESCSPTKLEPGYASECDTLPLLPCPAIRSMERAAIMALDILGNDVPKQRKPMRVLKASVRKSLHRSPDSAVVLPPVAPRVHDDVLSDTNSEGESGVEFGDPKPLKRRESVKHVSLVHAMHEMEREATERLLCEKEAKQMKATKPRKSLRALKAARLTRTDLDNKHVLDFCKEHMVLAPPSDPEPDADTEAEDTPTSKMLRLKLKMKHEAAEAEAEAADTKDNSVKRKSPKVKTEVATEFKRAFTNSRLSIGIESGLRTHDPEEPE